MYLVFKEVREHMLGSINNTGRNSTHVYSQASSSSTPPTGQSFAVSTLTSTTSSSSIAPTPFEPREVPGSGLFQVQAETSQTIISQPYNQPERPTCNPVQVEMIEKRIQEIASESKLGVNDPQIPLLQRIINELKKGEAAKFQNTKDLQDLCHFSKDEMKVLHPLKWFSIDKTSDMLEKMHKASSDLLHFCHLSGPHFVERIKDAIQQGANVNIVDASNIHSLTALMYNKDITQQEKLQAINLLKQAGATIHFSSYQRSLLYSLSTYCNIVDIECLKLVLEHGAIINLKEIIQTAKIVRQSLAYFIGNIIILQFANEEIPQNRFHKSSIESNYGTRKILNETNFFTPDPTIYSSSDVVEMILSYMPMTNIMHAISAIDMYARKKNPEAEEIDSRNKALDFILADNPNYSVVLNSIKKITTVNKLY